MYNQKFRDALEGIRSEGRYRYFADIERCAGDFPTAIFRDKQGEQHKITVWCSNDYLAMGQHPKVLSAMHKAIDENGAGAGGTRNISGTNHQHVVLENLLAKLHKRDAALLFTSGYAANEATIATLMSFLPDGVIFSDECNHASIVHGVRYSGAEKRIFKHNDLKDLEAQLKEVDIDQPKLIVFESLYSMDGDFAPISEICDLAEKYQAMTYVDEVHAIGVYGAQGMGRVEQLGEENRIDIIQSNFGKAVGVIGGYITGNHTLVDCVRSHAPPFIFTTALPPCVAAGALASIQHFNASTVERDALWAAVVHLKERLSQCGFNFIDHGSHILPIVIGDARRCKEITDRLLLRHNIYVQPINYPTVPKGTERLRVTPMPCHTPEMIDHFVESCQEVWKYYGIQLQQKSA